MAENGRVTPQEAAEAAHDHGHAHSLTEEERALQGEAGRRALVLALAITLVVLVAEAAGGWWSGSLGLSSDAVHMATDASALGLSLFALWFSARRPDAAKTYGYLRYEILAALFNGMALIAIAFGIVYEAWRRLVDPPMVKVHEMLAVATLGLVANLASAWLLHRTKAQSINVRGALLHVLGDALSSVAVIGAGLLMHFFAWWIADPAAAGVVALAVLWGAVRLVRRSVDVLLEAVPPHIDVSRLEEALREVGGVVKVHDLHVWTLTSGVHLMTCHVVCDGRRVHQEILDDLNRLVREEWKIHHSTIQLEAEDICEGESRFCTR